MSSLYSRQLYTLAICSSLLDCLEVHPQRKNRDAVGKVQQSDCWIGNMTHVWVGEDGKSNRTWMLPICDSAPFLLGVLCCNSWPQFTRCPFHHLNKQCALETRRRMRKRPPHHNSAIFELRSFNDYDPKGIRSNICSFLLADFGGNMFGSCAWSWATTPPVVVVLLFWSSSTVWSVFMLSSSASASRGGPYWSTSAPLTSLSPSTRRVHTSDQIKILLAHRFVPVIHRVVGGRLIVHLPAGQVIQSVSESIQIHCRY